MRYYSSSHVKTGKGKELQESYRTEKRLQIFMTSKPREDLGDFSWDKHNSSKKGQSFSVSKAQIPDLRESTKIKE